MKLGILSDMHLGLVQYGLKEREEDFYNQYLTAVDVFINAKVDIVIIAGDVFDKPRPSPKALKVFTNGLNKLFSNGIKVCNIIGNHSMIQSPDFITADEFIESVSNFGNSYFLLDDDDCIMTEEVNIVGYPYHHNYQLDELSEKINRMNDLMGETGLPNILVLHQSFKEFCGFAGEDFSIHDIDTSNFDLVICGHIHENKLIDIGNNTVFLQPGSLERSSIAEARDEEVNGKGVFIVDTKDMSIEAISNGFCRLKSDRKFLIADMYMNTEEDIQSIEKELKEESEKCSVPPVVFLTVHDKTGSFLKLVDLTKKMDKTCLTVHFNYFDESKKADSVIMNNTGEIPKPREALKIALNPLEKDEARLGLDLYDSLKDGKDVQGILDDFLTKRQEKREKEELPEFFDDELKEIEEYFENL